MKKIGIMLVCVVILVGMTMVPGIAGDGCTKIKDGILLNSNGNVIVPGYDEWGYNYQAHMFNGWYHNAGRPTVPWTEETLIAAGKTTTWLIMKWNDAWLSNKDCDDDGLLDRHLGLPTYRGSGAWVTNHQSGTYIDEVTFEECKWMYFVKMASAPTTAYKIGLMWYTEDGIEIGSVIWTHHARILQISNDRCAGESGVLNKWEAPTGPGYYKK